MWILLLSLLLSQLMEEKKTWRILLNGILISLLRKNLSHSLHHYSSLPIIQFSHRVHQIRSISIEWCFFLSTIRSAHQVSCSSFLCILHTPFMLHILFTTVSECCNRICKTCQKPPASRHLRYTRSNIPQRLRTNLPPFIVQYIIAHWMPFLPMFDCIPIYVPLSPCEISIFCMIHLAQVSDNGTIFLFFAAQKMQIPWTISRQRLKGIHG